jgi:predicted Rossmann fold flavoprotein
MLMFNPDVVILGAGASGLMCAIEGAKRGRKVYVLDHANKAGKKILMSGGGRCNFTNYQIEAQHYLSNNPHFCKSALRRFTQWDFIALVEKCRIPYHERAHGQLFCDDSAKDILNLLLSECKHYGVEIVLNCILQQISRTDTAGFNLQTSLGEFNCSSLVVATGGLSIPKMGASPIGYKIASQFGINLIPTRAGLVPLTLQNADKERLSPLSGIAVPCEISYQQQTFKENLLFTHRGISGPAVLQISSYWQPGSALTINLLPEIEIFEQLKLKRQQGQKQKLQTVLSEFLPKRLLQTLINETLMAKSLANCTDPDLQSLTDTLQQWQIKPNASEGYRTAEVTLGGVDCDTISSKTFASLNNPGLYFIGEVLDVTGWLGGYNFQWAWSSGWCAGQFV